jgi:DNA-binding NarL/FixJ family response regulator
MAKKSRASASAPSARSEPPKTRILVVDDHPIVRERLAELINQESDLCICGEAEDSHSAIKAVQSLDPDLAIVDITLKDTYGIELIRQFKELRPKLPVLVLSMHDESLYGERALRAGAKGYLTKQEASRQVITAIRRILGGGVYVSEKMAATILHKVAGGMTPQADDPTSALTDRELEVFQLLGQGQGVRQIAESLFISVKTVEAHREHIKRKMGFKSSAELLRHAIQFTLKDGRQTP